MQKQGTCCSLLPGFFLSSLESVASEEHNNAMHKHATINSVLILTALQYHYNKQTALQLYSPEYSPDYVSAGTGSTSGAYWTDVQIQTYRQSTYPATFLEAVE